MDRAIVIAANPLREVFALENEAGQCGIFWVLVGPPVFVGDILRGDVTCWGRCQFVHVNGICWVHGESEVFTRQQALAFLAKSTLHVVGYRARAGSDPLTNQGGKRVKSRLFDFLAIGEHRKRS